MIQQIRRCIWIHLLHDVSSALWIERFNDGGLNVTVDLLQRLGGDLFVQSFKDRFSLGWSQILDDIGDIGRMESRQSLVLDAQLHAARGISFDQIDELPGNHPWLQSSDQCLYSHGGRYAFQQAAHRTTHANINLGDLDADSTVRRFRMQVDVVHTNDFSSVDVDDLLIQQVALEKKKIVQGSCFRPFRCRRRSAHLRV